MALSKLEAAVGYHFGRPALLRLALTHPSCGPQNNQRLEFLGDAVFGLLSADAVFAAYPDEQEGPLTVRRTHLVSGAMLANTSRKIGSKTYHFNSSGVCTNP